MRVHFRIREAKIFVHSIAGDIVFIPERLDIITHPSRISGQQTKTEEQWTNISKDLLLWYTTFDLAKERIKEYVEQHNIEKPVDVKIYLMPEFSYDTEDPKSTEAESKFTHSFGSLNTILQYCKNAGITDKFLIEGLENSIKEGCYIKRFSGSTIFD